MATTSQPKPTMDTYLAPQRLLVPCAGCGCTVLRGEYVHGKVRTFDLPRTPMGEKHDCQQALQRWQTIKGWLDGKGVLTRVLLPGGQEAWMLMALAEGVRLEDLEGQELTFEVREEHAA